MKVMSRWAGLFAVMTGLLGPTSAYAYLVQPLRQEIRPAEGVVSGTITVTNQREGQLPVELVVLKRVFNEKGEISTEDGSSDFLIFPPQQIVGAGRSQAFRYQYIGPPLGTQSQAYTIEVREVPVEFPENFTGFRMAYNFGVAIYVRAAGAKSSLSIVDSQVDETGMMVTFANRGTGFGRLTNDRLIVRQGERQITLEGEGITSRIENPVIPPDRSRTLRFNIDGLQLVPGRVTVQLREVVD